MTKMGQKKRTKQHEFPCVMFYTAAQEHLPASSCTCPKRKKVKRTTLRNRADRMFSELIRQQGYCEGEEWNDGIECGAPLQCAHIIGRANYRLRWVPDNAFCLCRSHHVYYTNHPLDWYVILETRYPARFERLRALQHEPWDKDYDRVLNWLKIALEGE